MGNLDESRTKEEEEEEAGPEKPPAPCVDLTQAENENKYKLGNAVDWNKYEEDVRKACLKGVELEGVQDVHKCMIMCLEERDIDYPAFQMPLLKPAIKIGCRQGCGGLP